MNEGEIIRTISGQINSLDARVGDVGILPKVAGDEVLVSTTDQINQHHLFPGENHYSATRRGLVEAVSDIAASGSHFLGIQIDLRSPKGTPKNAYEQIGLAVNDFLLDFGGMLFQANNLSQGEFGISFTAYGKQQQKLLLGRQGAKEGDLIALSGPSGRWNAALAFYNAGSPKGLTSSELKELQVYFQGYTPELQYGLILAESGLVHSCLDTNDRLSKSLQDLQKCGSAGFYIRPESIPMTGLSRKVADIVGANPLDFALYDVAGDDNLLFTFSSKDEEELRDSLKKYGLEAHVIGNVFESVEGVSLNGIPMIEKGFEYFNNNTIYSQNFRMEK